MNVLFVLYGDTRTNTWGPISLFANKLINEGHDCVIAIPNYSDDGNSLSMNTLGIPTVNFDEVFLNKGKLFSNGEKANIIHASTPRIVIQKFLIKYQEKWPTPLIIYLEDNEIFIVEKYLDLSYKDILKLSNVELSKKIPDQLSNPVDYPYLLLLADALILIQDKLQIELPCYTRSFVIPWGVELDFFSPQAVSKKYSRVNFGIKDEDMVIVYHGGLNGFNREALIDLCKAVELINEYGVRCFLIRSGVNAFNFWEHLKPSSKNYIVELGVIDRSELPGLLNLADLFVQPGRIDPFEDLRLPSKVPEFLSMGKPVLMPNVNIATWMTDGADAIILKSGEPEEIARKCVDIFKDKQLLNDLGRNARAMAEVNFSLEKQSKKLIEAMQAAINLYDARVSTPVWRVAIDEGVQAAAIKKIELQQKLDLIADAVAFVQTSFICHLLGARVNSLTGVIEDNKQYIGLSSDGDAKTGFRSVVLNEGSKILKCLKRIVREFVD